MGYELGARSTLRLYICLLREHCPPFSVEFFRLINDTCIRDMIGSCPGTEL